MSEAARMSPVYSSGAMSQGRTLRIRDVAAYLRVSHQRVTQMHAEGKLPEPDQVDGIGPMWKPARIERWRAGVVGDAALGVRPANQTRGR